MPLIVDLTVEENARLKVLYGSHEGFHAIDLDSAQIHDIFVVSNVGTDFKTSSFLVVSEQPPDHSPLHRDPSRHLRNAIASLFR